LQESRALHPRSAIRIDRRQWSTRHNDSDDLTVNQPGNWSTNETATSNRNRGNVGSRELIRRNFKKNLLFTGEIALLSYSFAVNPQLRPAKAPFGITIFLSAFLLFWVQLLLGKYILPWFGGAAAVWTTCMLFFQVLLVGGYAYAHWLGRLKSRVQALLHCAIVVSSLLLLGCLALIWNSPITPGSNWKPHGADHPVLQIVTLLSVSVGLPFFVLSTTGPLLQVWYWRVSGSGSPYRLYSLSNLGSFLSLLAFPVLLEPGLTLKSQAWLWSSAYLVFAISCMYSAWRGVESSRQEIASQEVVSTESAEGARPGKGRYLLWGSLSACASILFLATTNQICQDIGVVPLLWIVPLGIYLLTFVICFEHDGWYSRKWFHLAFGLAMWAACFVLYDGALRSIVTQIVIYVFVLFICCMVCNGELARAKPQPDFLTSFYLTVAVGGALGGIFVALVTPHIFKGFWEYQMGLWMAALLLLVILVRDKESWLYRSKFGSPVVVAAVAALLPESAAVTVATTNKLVIHLSAFIALALIAYALSKRNKTGSGMAREKAARVYCTVALLIAALTLGGTAFARARNAIQTSRSFYGILSVRPQNMDDPARAAFSLVHGRVVHGFQMRAEADRRTPAAYFGPTSGVGIAIRHATSAASLAQGNLRIGVVGLGVGTIAAYGKPGDVLRFYEINPDVIRIASDRRYFTFLSDSPARIEVIPGDGRLSLERELERHEEKDFDVLVIDAFSGDAIPVHLLTLEAFEIYIKLLKKPSGILSIHITNSYLDLKPVVFSAARSLGLKVALVHSDGDGRTTLGSDWVLLSAGDNLAGIDAAERGAGKDATNVRTIHPWTDDYSNLIQIVNH
jgi:hypothetical protein